MPWTRKQVRKLLSSGSPLDAEQKASMKAELHSNPALGHRKKGSAAMHRKPIKLARDTARRMKERARMG